MEISHNHTNNSNILQVNQELLNRCDNACREGNLEELKNIYKLNSQFIIQISFMIMNAACIRGNEELAKWIYQIDHSIDISANNELKFRNACANGHIQLAKWLISIKPDIYIRAFEEFDPCQLRKIIKFRNTNDSVENLMIKNEKCAFSTTCANGHIDLAKWLLIIEPNINVNANGDYALVGASENNHINVVKWLLSLEKNYNLKEAFIKSCSNGNLAIAKIILNECNNLLDENVELKNSIFNSVCMFGRFEVAEWLLEIKPQIDIVFSMFANACLKGHLEIIKLLDKTRPDLLNSNINIKNLFNTACLSDNVEICEWIIQKDNFLLENNFIQTLFLITCSDGKIKISKWLLQIKPSIDISANNEEIFRSVCRNKFLNVARWLYTIKPSINISANNEEAFRNACVGANMIDVRHLEIAKWLYSLNTNINIMANEHQAFYGACANNDIETAEWLISVNPKYTIEVRQGFIVNYSIIIPLNISPEHKYIQTNEICSICLKDKSNLITNCNHQFHKDCLEIWHNKKRTCPNCIAQIDTCFQIEKTNKKLKIK